MQAVDDNKDQSYFLFPMKREALDRTLFPLGGMTKPEVRALAKRFELVTASKPESQDICFVPDQDHARVIREEHPDLDGAGEIVDSTTGRVVGKHEGYWRFTIGQRRGLGVSMGKPAYVSHIDPNNGRVTVSGAEGLWHNGLTAGGWTWTDRPEPGELVEARIRHRGQLVPCTISPEGDLTRVDFKEPAWAVAPGQAVVLYRKDKVLGGGWIRKAIEGQA
jgi:tRNA-specific 2-thiouridylase